MGWFGDKQPKDVEVYSMRGERLANTTVRKAAAMITKRKAEPYKTSPFAIRMLIPTGETGKFVEAK